MAETEQASGSSHEDDKPPSSVGFNFMVPKKEISMVPDMGKWKRSQAYADYIGFILTLNEGVKGKKLTCEYQVSETVEKLLALLGTLDQWIDETPPVDQPSRFGNKAFRTWYAKLDQEAEALVAGVLPAERQDAAPEIAVYLKETVEKLLALLGTLDQWIDETPLSSNAHIYIFIWHLYLFMCI
nr:Protein phosphatase 2A activator, regulatory subunit 4 [Danio rerio]